MEKTVCILLLLILFLYATDLFWRCNSGRYENGLPRRDIGNCLRVYPRKIHTLLSIIPFQGFILVSDQENGFGNHTRLHYSSGNFQSLLKLTIGDRMIFVFAFMNPFFLGDDGFDVAVGDCYATVDIISI